MAEFFFLLLIKDFLVIFLFSFTGLAGSVAALEGTNGVSHWSPASDRSEI